MFKKNTAGQFIYFQGVDVSTGGIKSGVTWTVRRCIDGTFAAATGTVTEDGTTGWYKFALSQADTNGNNIGINFTGTGAVPQTVNFVTTSLDPYDTVRAGMTALPNAAAEAAGGLYTRGSGAGQILQPSNGVIQTPVTVDGQGYVTVATLDSATWPDIKNQVVAALETDTYTEPGQGAPPASPSIRKMVHYLYKAFRNKVTQTSTTMSIYNDAGSTVDQKATVSDDGSTFTRDEIVSGP